MRYKEWLQDNKGFSLIEVVLAVAILALVTLPIMNYFTYSAQQTFEGRDKQTANMVAESALEELDSYNNFEQIEKLQEEGVWTVDNSALATTKMERDMENNGRDYTVSAVIDYDVYDKETRTIVPSGAGIGAEINSDYNDYEIPQPSEVYSAENVVASEGDQIDTAISEFYLKNRGGFGNEAIKNQVDRTICVDVDYAITGKNSTRDTTIYNVGVYYEYQFNGEIVKVYLEEAEIEVDKLENIFVFYKLLKDGVSEEKISVNFATDIPTEDIEKIKIYFARQTHDSIVPPSNYMLNMVSTDARAFYAKYYTNVEMANFQLALKEDGTRDDFVSKEKKKRIGKITVEVKEKNGSDVLATLSTTKAE